MERPYKIRVGSDGFNSNGRAPVNLCEQILKCNNYNYNKIVVVGYHSGKTSIVDRKPVTIWRKKYIERVKEIIAYVKIIYFYCRFEIHT